MSRYAPDSEIADAARLLDVTPNKIQDLLDEGRLDVNEEATGALGRTVVWGPSLDHFNHQRKLTVRRFSRGALDLELERQAADQARDRCLREGQPRMYTRYLEENRSALAGAGAASLEPGIRAGRHEDDVDDDDDGGDPLVALSKRVERLESGIEAIMAIQQKGRSQRFVRDDDDGPEVFEHGGTPYHACRVAGDLEQQAADEARDRCGREGQTVMFDRYFEENKVRLGVGR